MRPRAVFFTLLTSFAGVGLFAAIGGGRPADGAAQATRSVATQPATAVASRATTSRPAAKPPTSAPISTTASAPASRPRGPVQFQPGVWIDWNERAVAAAGRVVLNEGPLELIACFHSKEHESVVKFDCKALHLFMALGLIGLTPGHPPRWNDATSGYEPAEGDLVDVWIEYDVAGTTKRVHPFAWLREMEFDRNPLPRPLVFAGSKLLDADTIASDMNGVGISIVDQAESLICLTRSRSDRNDDLWAFADTAAIPSLGTPVKIVFRAAAPVARKFSLDFRGAAYVDGVYADVDEFADFLRITRRLAPDARIRIAADEAFATDVERWRRELETRGIARNWVEK